MSASEIKKLGETGKKLPVELGKLLEVHQGRGEYIPVGKYVKGKKVHLIYMWVGLSVDEKSTNIDFYYKLLHKKSGEIISSKSYLLAINTRYSASFKRVGEDQIVITTKDLESGDESTYEYTFGKERLE
jgi:hypothetical protein